MMLKLHCNKSIALIGAMTLHSMPVESCCCGVWYNSAKNLVGKCFRQCFRRQDYTEVNPNSDSENAVQSAAVSTEPYPGSPLPLDTIRTIFDFVVDHQELDRLCQDATSGSSGKRILDKLELRDKVTTEILEKQHLSAKEARKVYEAKFNTEIERLNNFIPRIDSFDFGSLKSKKPIGEIPLPLSSFRARARLFRGALSVLTNSVGDQNNFINMKKMMQDIHSEGREGERGEQEKYKYIYEKAKLLYPTLNEFQKYSRGNYELLHGMFGVDRGENIITGYAVMQYINSKLPDLNLE